MCRCYCLRTSLFARGRAIGFRSKNGCPRGQVLLPDPGRGRGPGASCLGALATPGAACGAAPRVLGKCPLPTQANDPQPPAPLDDRRARARTTTRVRTEVRPLGGNPPETPPPSPSHNDLGAQRRCPRKLWLRVHPPPPAHGSPPC